MLMLPGMFFCHLEVLKSEAVFSSLLILFFPASIIFSNDFLSLCNYWKAIISLVRSSMLSVLELNCTY